MEGPTSDDTHVTAYIYSSCLLSNNDIDIENPYI